MIRYRTREIGAIEILLIVVAALLASSVASARPPDPKLWQEATDIAISCETDNVKLVNYHEAPGNVAGTRLTSDNMYPENYTTGDMVASCKLTARDTNLTVGEFTRLPVAYNKSTKAFEFDYNDLRFQISGFVMMETIKVYRKKTQAKPRAKPK